MTKKTDSADFTEIAIGGHDVRVDLTAFSMMTKSPEDTPLVFMRGISQPVATINLHDALRFVFRFPGMTVRMACGQLFSSLDEFEASSYPCKDKAGIFTILATQGWPRFDAVVELSARIGDGELGQSPVGFVSAMGEHCLPYAPYLFTEFVADDQRLNVYSYTLVISDNTAAIISSDFRSMAESAVDSAISDIVKQSGNPDFKALMIKGTSACSTLAEMQNRSKSGVDLVARSEEFLGTQDSSFLEAMKESGLSEEDIQSLRDLASKECDCPKCKAKRGAAKGSAKDGLKAWASEELSRIFKRGADGNEAKH